MYQDNCVRDETGKCHRKRWVGGEDKVWQRKATKRRKRAEKRRICKAAVSALATETCMEVASQGIFLQIEVKTRLKSSNVNVMECLVVMQAVYKVEARKAPRLLAYIGNNLFGQQWVSVDEDEKKDETKDEDNGETTEEEKNVEVEFGAKKKRKITSPLNYTIY